MVVGTLLNMYLRWEVAHVYSIDKLVLFGRSQRLQGLLKVGQLLLVGLQLNSYKECQIDYK